MEINENNFEQYSIDFLENNLNDSEKKCFQLFLTKNSNFNTEFDELKNIWNQIETPQIIVPSKKMDTVFYDFLAKESSTKVTTLWYKSSIVKYAASFLGFICAYFLGIQNADNQKVITKVIPQKIIIKEKIEVPVYHTKYIVKIQKTKEKSTIIEAIAKTVNQDLKIKTESNSEKLLTLIGRKSASERIMAVNYSYEINNPDEIVLKTLIYTLDYDLNVNVRMAAADAIARFGSYEIVRDALVKSLLKQQDPQLQISIIELLTNLHEKRAIPAFRLLVEDDSNDEMVRNRARKGNELLMM